MCRRQVFLDVVSKIATVEDRRAVDDDDVLFGTWEREGSEVH